MVGRSVGCTADHLGWKSASWRTGSTRRERNFFSDPGVTLYCHCRRPDGSNPDDDVGDRQQNQSARFQTTGHHLEAGLIATG
jgi:hypothetical protein